MAKSASKVVDENSLKLFNTIKNKNLSRQDIAQKLRKVASFDDGDDLNTVLRQIIRQYSNTFEKTLEELIESKDMEVLHYKDGKIYAKVNNFDGAQEFGSPEWCISTSETYFSEYLAKIADENYITEDDFNSESITTESMIDGVHVFCWDFNKEEENELRQYAITLSSGNTLVAAYDKEDESI